MKRSMIFAMLISALGLFGVLSSTLCADPPPDSLRLSVRSLAADPATSKETEKTESRTLVPGETAILLCDVWDRHWCSSATRRCDALAKQMGPLVERARAAGVKIIHCPSDTMEFYRGHPARRRATELAAVVPPSPIGANCKLDRAKEGSLPIDDSDGGCDCLPQCKQGSPWKRQHPAIRVDDADLVSDNGQQVYNYLKSQGIKNLLYMGVHTNMCVLGRSFGIRQMTAVGANAILVRDLTDTMYNPRMAPKVDHAAGTELVIRHIERHWCPTTTSSELLAGLP